MTPAGIEPATFRFVAQHLSHCATAVPNLNRYETYFCNITLYIKNILCNNQASFLVHNFLQNISYVTWRWPTWPKYVTKYTTLPITTKRFCRDSHITSIYFRHPHVCAIGVHKWHRSRGVSAGEEVNFKLLTVFQHTSTALSVTMLLRTSKNRSYNTLLKTFTFHHNQQLR